MQITAYTVQYTTDDLFNGLEIRSRSGHVSHVVDLRDSKQGPEWVRFGLANEKGECTMSMDLKKGEHVITSYMGEWQ